VERLKAQETINWTSILALPDNPRTSSIMENYSSGRLGEDTTSLLGFVKAS
jgi:hypothetical protein